VTVNISKEFEVILHKTFRVQACVVLPIWPIF